MKLSPPFARNAEDRMQLCLNELDKPVLVTDEFVEQVIAHVFDDSVIIQAQGSSVIVPVYGFGVPDLRIDLNKYLVQGGYVVRAGWGRIDGHRVIAVRGELDKLPPVDDSAEMP